MLSELDALERQQGAAAAVTLLCDPDGCPGLPRVRRSLAAIAARDCSLMLRVAFAATGEAEPAPLSGGVTGAFRTAEGRLVFANAAVVDVEIKPPAKLRSYLATNATLASRCQPHPTAPAQLTCLAAAGRGGHPWGGRLLRRASS